MASSVATDLAPDAFAPRLTVFPVPETMELECQTLGFPPPTRHQLFPEFARQLQSTMLIRRTAPMEPPFGRSGAQEISGVCSFDLSSNLGTSEE